MHLRPWPTLTRLSAALFEYIEVYYNRQRRHSTLDYLSPEEYEMVFDKKELQAA